jgi:hypothetical protein
VVVNFRERAAEAEALCAELEGSRAVRADVATTEGCERLVAAALALMFPLLPEVCWATKPPVGEDPSRCVWRRAVEAGLATWPRVDLERLAGPP